MKYFYKILLMLIILNLLINFNNCFAVKSIPLDPEGVFNELPGSEKKKEFNLKETKNVALNLGGEISVYTKSVLDYILIYPTFLAIVVIIYAGIMMIVKSQDENWQKMAKNVIIYSFIGLTLVYFAYVIIKFVASWV